MKKNKLDSEQVKQKIIAFSHDFYTLLEKHEFEENILVKLDGDIARITAWSVLQSDDKLYLILRFDEGACPHCHENQKEKDE